MGGRAGVRSREGGREYGRGRAGGRAGVRSREG